MHFITKTEQHRTMTSLQSTNELNFRVYDVSATKLSSHQSGKQSGTTILP